jgi:putative transposase
VIRRQAYRYRLTPTAAQATLLRQFLGCSRLVWNTILAENDYRFERGDPLPLKLGAFCERLNALKARLPFLREVHSQPLQQTLRDLTRAYESAFDPKLAAEMPTFKKKQNGGGFRFPQGFKVEQSGVYLPKIGWVSFRVSKRSAKRKFDGKVKNVTVRLEAGRWFVSLQVEREVSEPVHPNNGSAVGIDLGIARFAALSNGTFFDGANAFKNHERRLAILQRRLARKVKFSSNWKKAKARITAIHSRIANLRKDQIHKASATISKNHAVVVLEDLAITNMSASAKGTIEEPGTHVSAKSGLNRRILDQGWGEFRRQLGYKLAWLGGTILLVDPRNTSRRCSACGHVNAENRRTQAAFACVECGHASNADTNAAKNILGRAGLARIACGESQDSTKQEALCIA